MRTQIWLTRHAQTAVPHVFHGAESDVGLSELGQRQAAAAAQHFRELRPDAVASSGMLRARLTAAPIAAALGLEHHVEPDLHERRVGELSGTPHDDPAGPWPHTLRRWIEGETSYAPPGSESFDEIQARVVPAWERLAARYAGRTAVVVAHGIVCRVLLLTLVEGWSVEDWTRLGRIPNLGVTELVPAAGGWKVERLCEVPAVVAALGA